MQPDGVGDPRLRGNVRVLELPVRVRHVVARDTEHGPAKSKIAFSARMAATSDANPQTRGASFDHDRTAGLDNRCEQAVLVQRLQRAEIHVTSHDASPASDSATRWATPTIALYATIVTSEPSWATRALAERYDVLALGDVATREPIDQLRLEHDHGIGIANRRSQKPFRVRRCRRDRDLHPRCVDVVRLRGVVVELEVRGRSRRTASG